MFVGKKTLLPVVLISMLFTTNSIVSASTDEVGRANINVVAPSTNPLTLEQVPGFEFGKVKYQNSLGVSASSSERYQTLDLRGQPNATYAIQVEISDFKSIKSQKTLPMKEFLMSVGDSSDGAIKGNSDVNVYKVIGTVAEGTTGSKKQEVSGPVSGKINLTTTSGIEMDEKYTATLTHRIVAGV